ncbi:MAG: hypothetical protein JSW63_12875 [Ignavibacterium sp.]|nr:MAG: hypothetical protein JSW63_12875 [Ignavibacterium sp.]
MKRLIPVILIIMFPSVLTAQARISVGVICSANIGLSNFGEKYGTDYGGAAFLFFSPSSVADLTLSVGYNKWEKDNESFTSVPLLVGFRYYYDLKVVKFYLPAFLGLHFTTKGFVEPTAVVDGSIYGGNEISMSHEYFGFGLGLGVLVPLSSKLYLDISTTFNSIAATESNLNYIAINGGIQIGL